jgi:hypothetical protein
MLEIFIKEAMKRAGNYWYLFPTRAWAERAIWDNTQTIEIGGVEKTGKLIDICLGDLPVVKSEKNLSVRFPNGSLIRFSGTDDLSFVGQGGYGYGISEDSIHRPDVTSYISPILEEANAWLIRQGTLRGKQNHLYKAICTGFKSEAVFTQWLTPEITKAYCWVGGKVSVNPELLGRINPLTKRPYLNVQDLVDIGEISYSLAYREYLNRATNNTDDGYYSNEYEIAKNEGRIGRGAHIPDLPVYTFWDLGKGTAANCTDAMAMWLVQFPDNDLPNPKKIRLIGFEETRGGVWEDHATLLRGKGYEFGGHFMPWDINKGAAGVSGNNLLWAKEAGIEFTPVQRRGQGIMSAIELCRRAWALLEFAPGTATDGAERLSEYHEKKDREGNFLGVPEHDSNSCNCFTGDTLIWMEDGTEKRIDEILAGDFVRLSDNYSARVLDAWMVDEDAKVVEVELSTGEKIKCTGDHKIFTQKGIVPADALRYGDVIATRRNKLWQSMLSNRIPLAESVLLFLTEKNGTEQVQDISLKREAQSGGAPKDYIGTCTPASRQRTGTTAISKQKTGSGVVDILTHLRQEKRRLSMTVERFICRTLGISIHSPTDYCTGISGKKSAVGFQKTSASTTKTATKQTTLSRISKCLRTRNTRYTTQKQTSGSVVAKTENSFCQSMIKPKNGTALLKGLRGTGSTENGRGKIGYGIRTLAGSASRSTPLRTRINLSGAQETVKVVQELGETSKVYHLTISTYEAYYANGILVKNCADAFRTMVEALDKNIVRYNPPNDATQGDKEAVVLTMTRQGESKPVVTKSMLCSKGKETAQKTLADIRRMREEKRTGWKR